MVRKTNNVVPMQVRIGARLSNKSVNLTPGGAGYPSVKWVAALVQWPLSLMSYAKSQRPLCARIDVGQCVVEGANK